MAKEKVSSHPSGDDEYGFTLFAWGCLVAVLAVGGLLLAARAADDYMAASGFLFFLFGAFWASRILKRLLP